METNIIGSNIMEPVISLAYGSGGDLTRKLIEEEFVKNFSNPILDELLDSGIVEFSGKLAFTTDSYVITPIFFKGGDIGSLSVYGTLNDLAVVGAEPLFISLSLIIEEGLAVKDLKRIINSISKVAKEEKVKIITGDTKVVDKNKGDKIFINTSGIGIIKPNRDWRKREINEGDLILASGDLGEHGIYIMLERLNIKTAEDVKSDMAYLGSFILPLLDNFDGVKFIRDATRGGVATILNEVASKYNIEIEVYEEELPYKDWVKNASEILGIDPIYAANEGKAVIIIDKSQADEILDFLKKHPLSCNSKIIGKVISKNKPKVYLKTRIGSRRILESLKGDILPRIC
ncbi:MAG: hydrogenase expression/formation protein HypE [bacterium]|nr:hydrogenase expression/formation protein HypE [bacterium]